MAQEGATLLRRFSVVQKVATKLRRQKGVRRGGEGVVAQQQGAAQLIRVWDSSLGCSIAQLNAA